MVGRGIATQAIYGNFLQELSHLSHLYLSLLTGDSQPGSPFQTPTRDPRQHSSAVASGRRPRHPISPMRDVFGNRRAVATSTAAAAKPHHSSKDKRKRSFDDRVSAIIRTIRSKFSDDDSPDSPQENLNDSTTLSDVPHNDDDHGHDIQDIVKDLSAFANKPA